MATRQPTQKSIQIFSRATSTSKHYFRFAGLVCLIAFTVSPLCFAFQNQEAQKALEERTLTQQTGDLDKIRERNQIRVLVTYNKTNYFYSAGVQQGFEYELLKEYEKHLNASLSRKDIKTTMVFIPITRAQLIPYLLEGRGDIAAAGLTVTPERQKHVAFSDPYLNNVSEVVVTKKGASSLNSLDDLAGRDVHIAKGSVYVHILQNLNDRLRAKGRPKVNIVEVEDHLETEDILELVNAGVIEFTVVDKYLVELWSSVLTEFEIRDELTLSEGGKLAWAVRKNSPQLLASLNEFMKKNKKGTLIGNILFKRYFGYTKWIRNPVSRENQEKLDDLAEIVQKYASQYGFDWLGISAVAYQESKYQVDLRSRAGAIGLMQIKPETAAQVGISNIENVENNVHAAVKYFDWLRKTYFDDPGISAEAKVDFILAAYNAGPSRIRRLRQQASSMGYDPNKWFGNVEQVALRTIGQETVQYVANINKYYFALRQSWDMLLRRDKERGKF